ncbi:MAG: chitobiase/beta-hexosaminidase C-terminal domain-containing protein [Clostridiales Family XIII bacterium]|jgi:hypothetical protein|nr:chitobiase/beta-hexosaminidase C-terminal domain-containing protein [Clostridiales Family XIII bacterium]
MLIVPTGILAEDETSSEAALSSEILDGDQVVTSDAIALTEDEIAELDAIAAPGEAATSDSAVDEDSTALDVVVTDVDVVEAPAEEPEPEPVPAVVTPEGFTVTKEYAIGVATDDSFANATYLDAVNSGVYLNGKYSATLLFDSYLRFADVQLPADAFIVSAELKFTMRDAAPRAGNLTVYRETSNLGALRAPVATYYNPRTWSTEAVTFDTPVLSAGSAYTTPDISALVRDQLANSPGKTDYVFKIVGNTPDNPFVVRSMNYSATYAPKLSITYITSTGEYNATVGGSYNDSEEYGVNKAIAIEDSMQIGGYYSRTLTDPYKEIAAFRFENVNLPANATIDDAYIEFTTYADGPAGAVSNIRIRTELGYPAQYKTTAGDISARNYGRKYVDWTAESFRTSRATVRTPNLQSIIDENRLAGWQSGGSLAFMLDGNNFIGSVYAGGTAYAARLVIKYHYGGGPVDNGVWDTSIRKEYRITDYRDDSEEYAASHVIAINDSMQIGGYYSASNAEAYWEIAAFRFQNVYIPENATITNAYIEFTTYADGPVGAMSNILIRSEVPGAGKQAAQYTTKAYDISNRNYSKSSVLWQAQSFRTSLSKVQTPNLADVIDEARFYGWQSGDPLAFMLDGDAFIGSVYYGGTSYSPKLIIEYELEGGGIYRNIITDANQISNVYINELSTSGTKSNEEDWVEIYNANSSFVLLGDTIRLWRDTNTKGDTFNFSGLLLAPNSYTVLTADGNTAAGKDHLSFDFKKSAEVFLTQQASASSSTVVRVIDSFKYSETPYNQTAARKPDASADIYTMESESYGYTNNNAPILLDISFSHSRGVYATGFPLTMTGPQGASIRYTLDGSTPTATNGLTYTNAIPITTTCVVRAVAVTADGTSVTTANTYVLQNNLVNEVKDTAHMAWINKDTIINSQQYAAALADLPILSVSSDVKEISHVVGSDYVQGYFEYIPVGGTGTDQTFYSPVGVKRFGQESIRQWNSGIAIRFKKDYGAGKAKYEFFESLPGEPWALTGEYKKLELHEGQDGPSRDVYRLGYLRYDETAVRRLAALSGIFDSHVQYVHYFYNGKYMGIKTMREDFGPQTFEPYTGIDSDEFTKVTFQDSASFATGIVEAGDGDAAVWKTIKATVTAKDFQAFKQYVDVDSLIRNQILFMFIDTENEMNGVVQNSVGSGGMKMMFNINDSDGAFFNAGYTDKAGHSLSGGGGTYRYKWVSNAVSRRGPAGMFGAFSGDSTTLATAGNLEFKTLVKDRVLEMIGPAGGDWRGATGAPLSVDSVTKVLSEEQARLAVSYRLDAAFQSVRPTIVTEWEAKNKQVLAQVPDRVQYSLEMWLKYGMAHTLSAPVVVPKDGGTTLVNPNAGTVIYYTLDGTDPLGANGAIPGQAGANPAAKVYNGETIPAGSTITARAFKTNNWGPLTIV